MGERLVDTEPLLRAEYEQLVEHGDRICRCLWIHVPDVLATLAHLRMVRFSRRVMVRVRFSRRGMKGG